MSHEQDIASAARRDLREDALLGLAVPLSDARGLFGPRILPLNPYHHLLLVGYKNACFCGGARTLSSVMQYLWFCSPSCRPSSKYHFQFFAWRWQFALGELRPSSHGPRVRGPTERVLRAISAHAAQIYLDRPIFPRKRGEKPLVAAPDGPHELAALELLCRHALDYTRSEFWHTPYAHTNQLLALHFAQIQRADPNRPKFDPARGNANAAWLRDRRLAREAAAKNAAARN